MLIYQPRHQKKLNLILVHYFAKKLIEAKWSNVNVLEQDNKEIEESVVKIDINEFDYMFNLFSIFNIHFLWKVNLFQDL